MPIIKNLNKDIERKKLIDISVNIAGITFKNPVMVASGTYGYGRDYESFYSPAKLGAVMVKGTTLLPKAGNKPPRIIETPAGMINAVGLQNDGIECFCQQHLPYLRDNGVTVILNFSGNTIDDYCAIAKRVENEPGIAMLEANISCPNVKKGGLAFGADDKVASELVKKLKKVSSIPLIVKLSPNVTDITSIAKAVENAGADCISLINTILGMRIDINYKRPYIANNVGGLSGPAIKPVAIRMIWQVANTVSIPIIGMGGITCASDAIEFLLAGADAISIGTANFVDPYIAIKVVDGINEYMKNNNIENMKGFKGLLKCW